MARRLLWASLGLAPVTMIVDFAFHAGAVPIFVLAAVALVPLAWLIGEATEHAALHTGPGIGGFLNATFGNAPELIIALFAVDDGLYEVARGSLSGSVAGNLLLVLGFSLLFGPTKSIDRSSGLISIGLVLLATLMFLIVAVPSWHGDTNRHSLQVLSIPVSAFLLVVYVVVTWVQLRRHRAQFAAEEEAVETLWPLRSALAVLAVATAVTAVVAEILVGSIQDFAEKAHLSDFFVAAVIVAIVGNAAEHGGAVVVARRGHVKLATEIALSSSAQVAVFLVPTVTILAWTIKPITLAFRQVELAVLGGSALLAALLLSGGKSSSWRGAVLIGAYAVAAAIFYKAGGR